MWSAAKKIDLPAGVGAAGAAGFRPAIGWGGYQTMIARHSWHTVALGLDDRQQPAVAVEAAGLTLFVGRRVQLVRVQLLGPVWCIPCGPQTACGAEPTCRPRGMLSGTQRTVPSRALAGRSQRLRRPPCAGPAGRRLASPDPVPTARTSSGRWRRRSVAARAQPVGRPRVVRLPLLGRIEDAPAGPLRRRVDGMAGGAGQCGNFGDRQQLEDFDLAGREHCYRSSRPAHPVRQSASSTGSRALSTSAETVHARAATSANPDWRAKSSRTGRSSTRSRSSVIICSERLRRQTPEPAHGCPGWRSRRSAATARAAPGCRGTRARDSI